MYIGLYAGGGGGHRYSRPILMNLNSLERFSKNSRIQNFIKIRHVGSEFFHADSQTDRRTDMTKLIVAFCNFENAPKNDTKMILRSVVASIRLQICMKICIVKGY